MSPGNRISVSTLLYFARHGWRQSQRYTILVCFGLLLPLSSIAQGLDGAEFPIRVEEQSLPTALPSGDTTNDVIRFTYYRPVGASSAQSIPGVILIHGLDIRGIRGRVNELTDPFARYLAKHGVASIAIDLPYHMRRLAPGDNPAKHFLSAEPERIAQAFKQSVSDVITVAGWLHQQPGIDQTRIGLIGISLGAVVAHLVMGKDEQFKTGVTLLGIGNLQEYFRQSWFYRLFHPHLTPDHQEKARQFLPDVDPIRFADRNPTRKVLMIQAARDMIFPPRYALDLWRALKKPTIRWLDTNHLGPMLASSLLWKRSLEYLQNVWKDPHYDARQFPQIDAPTLKLSLLSEWDAPPTVALQWQMFAIGKRSDHMSLFNANLGWGGRGFFLSLGVTLTPHLDIGLVHRVPGGNLTPYFSLHIVL
jgi:uncharacterized protein